MSNRITVADYLARRLQELNCQFVFGVAGNYSAAFLNTLIENPEYEIRVKGNTNEINAGHCADGYARLSRTIAPVCVTYGVGAFSLLNPIAGAYVEHNPLLVINGAPAYNEQQKQRVEGLLYSHMTGDETSNISAYRDVTVAAEQIKNANQAGAKIDAVLTACIAEQRPVYLEVFEDVWRQTCDAPCSALNPQPHQGCPSNTQTAVDKTLALIHQTSTPRSVLFWAGIEIQRQQLVGEFQQLIHRTQTPFMTSVLSKSLISESDEHFAGVYSGNATPDAVKTTFDAAELRIGLGIWNTSKNLGGSKIWDNTSVMAHNNGVKVGNEYIPNVMLGDYIKGLTQALAERPARPVVARRPCLYATAPDKADALSYDSFYASLNRYLRDEHILVVDAGFPLLGAQNLDISRQDGFVASAAWLSIGYSVPAALGVKFARPDARPLVCVGDGAFQETCQAVSGHAHFDTNIVVFVLDNGIYGIEQMLVNPNPFRQGDAHIDYPTRPSQNKVYAYNELAKWEYHKIVDMVGGKGIDVGSLEELDKAFAALDQDPDSNFVIRVKLPQTNIPSAIGYKLAGTGEDEVGHSGFPPFCPPKQA